MESIERKTENYAVVFNVKLLRATLNEATEFKDYLEEAILDSEKDIIVNLGSCEHLDSTFLGVLVSAYKRLKSQNRSLVIIEPIEQSSIFLTLNSIGKIFPLYSSVKVALQDIENKRLIEKEINELGQENIKLPENPLNVPFKITSIPLVNSLEDSISEETVQDEKEEIEIKSVRRNSLPEENDLVLIENDTSDKESENPFILKKEEVIAEQKTLQVNSDDKKDNETIITKFERVNEESRFTSGSVKWEFGFS